MSKQLAFTIESHDGILRDIKTDIGISISTDIKEDFHLETNIIKKRAIWDTGATGSVISEEIANDIIHIH